MEGPYTTLKSKRRSGDRVVPLPSGELDPFGMHVVQVADPELVECVVDGVLQVRRAGQSGTERVDEHRQLGPRAAAVGAADVRQHAFGDGPVTGDLGPERVGQPTPVAIGRGDHARGQQRQCGRDGGDGTPATTGREPHVCGRGRQTNENDEM